MDPSVQSSAPYGQSAGLYAPQPQSFATQQPTYGAQYNQPFSQTVSNPVPLHSSGQSSVLNPQPINTFAPGLPPIEVAQQAIPQNIQRNPTPPPGWNDPPALKSARAVSFYRLHWPTQHIFLTNDDSNLKFICVNISFF